METDVSDDLELDVKLNDDGNGEAVKSDAGPTGEVQRADLVKQIQQKDAENIKAGEREIAEVLARRKLVQAPVLIVTTSGWRFELPLRPRG